MGQNAASLDVIVRTNEKLLKALITLLSLKDQHLLEELKTIFVVASRGGNEIGKADPAVWAEIHRELELIEAMTSDDEEGSGGSGADSPGVKPADGVH